MSNQLTVTSYLQSDVIQQSLEKVLKDRTQQFVTSIASLVKTNPRLETVDKQSLLSACLIAATLDLPINQNLGFAYIIPYKDQAQFQMGYKGFIQLAMRTGQYKSLEVSEVMEGEIESHNRLTGQITFNWLTESREKAKTVGYVAYFETLSGFSKTLYMTNDELLSHAGRYSQSYKSGKGTNIWKDDFSSMAKKTVIKLLLSRWGIMTGDLQKAVQSDQATVVDESMTYPDNTKLTSDQKAFFKEQLRIEEFIKSATTTIDLGEVAEFVETYELTEMYDNKYNELSNAAN